MRVSTWGHWELNRTILIKNILNDDKIPDLTEELLNEILLTHVNTAMVQAIVAYNNHISAHEPSTSIETLTLESLKSALGVILDSLTNALNIEKNLLAPHVNQFCIDSLSTTNHLFTDIVHICRVTRQAKETAIDNLYGVKFRSQYPTLAAFLRLHDNQVINEGLVAAERLILSEDYGLGKQWLLDQLTYLTEIANHLADPLFDSHFRKITNSTMSEYKQKIAALSPVPQALNSHRLYSTNGDKKSSDEFYESDLERNFSI